ncbi:hypothetical protein ACIRPX_35625 [Streptomyces sp. NPDC101225]|uniref:hypothetical protein n=1 Tax=Streptomyces sp. NPDC101225 TaxID=3366135 RepID=UPI00380DA3E1
MPAPAVSLSPVGLPRALRRAGRPLTLWWPTHPPPVTPTRRVCVPALADILDDAVAAQPAADRAVAACGEPGFVPASAVRATAEQITVYHHLIVRHLIVRLRALHLSGDLLPVGERASRLLAHHVWILNQALSLVGAPQTDRGIVAARRQLNGLGSVAGDLRLLREEVRDIADRPRGEADRPSGEEAGP